VEGTLVGRAFSRDGHRDPVGPPPLERQCLAERGGIALRDDAGAGEVRIRVEQVHVPAAALAEPVHPAEDLGRHPLQIDSVGDGEVVRTVGGGDGVVDGQVRAHPRRDGFLSGGQVHFAGDGTGPDVEHGFLVGVVLPQDRFLEGADEHHGAVKLQPRRCVHAPSRVRRVFGSPSEITVVSPDRAHNDADFRW
jgi:hypothetical protein